MRKAIPQIEMLNAMPCDIWFCWLDMAHMNWSKQIFSKRMLKLKNKGVLQRKMNNRYAMFFFTEQVKTEEIQREKRGNDAGDIYERLFKIVMRA